MDSVVSKPGPSLDRDFNKDRCERLWQGNKSVTCNKASSNVVSGYYRGGIVIIVIVVNLASNLLKKEGKWTHH